MNKTKRVAEIFKTVRIEKGLSQTEFSRILGLKQAQYISNVERNLCGMSMKYIHRFSKTFHISMDTIKNAYQEDFRDFMDKEFNDQAISFWKSNEG